MKKWLIKNTRSLVGKKVAVTGTTGGIGKELCKYLAKLGARLILCDRNYERSRAFGDELIKEYGGDVTCLTVDLSDINSVKKASQELVDLKPDIFIHNAGAYSIPRYISDTGLDNVFEINFASPYYIIKELLPTLREKRGRVVVVGSIAHNYSKADFSDIDFHTKKAASKVYGNAKRYLMFSLFELFKNEREVTLSVTHPGITFTNITAHYPKFIFAIIKHPMKVIFMKPKKAALSVLKGVFEATGYHEWMGPRFLGIWGMPKKQKLRTVKVSESLKIGEIAEDLYIKLQKD
ncbi:MAG: SDR family NAD(P)-dependent oxidoreductase [Clostridia bacterium]|nr:SDR family NAD(P)-dependent oxidoreductase [Clostridia bacterium]